jgi:hypothetical protein
MDSEHRHELQQNDLEHFITHLGEWWTKYGARFSTTVLIIVGTLAAVRLVQGYSQNSMQNQLKAVAESRDPFSYENAAQAVTPTGLKATAILRAADLRLIAATNPAAGNPKEDIDKAESGYRQVVALAGVHDLFKLNAHLGLAAVEESRRDWAKAAAAYDAAIQLAGAHHPAIAQSAKSRKAALDKLRNPISFGGDDEAVRPALTAPGRLPFPLDRDPQANLRLDPLRGIDPTLPPERPATQTNTDSVIP